MTMYCNQCEQTAKGTGCSTVGVCGKQPETSALHDLLTHQLKGIGFLAQIAKQNGWQDDKTDLFVTEALFTSVTNVNFDNDRIYQLILAGQRIKNSLLEYVEKNQGTIELPSTVTFKPEATLEKCEEQAILEKLLMPHPDTDIESVRQLTLYGLRGMAAYVDHAMILGQKDSTVTDYIYKALSQYNDNTLTLEDWIGLAMECGQINIRAMELLDTGHTETYGHPEPTEVSTGYKEGPAIVITGHDLVDLEALLQQTEGTSVNIYTHGEMLPAHGYPQLKRYKHFVGHFGTAWQNQQKEFDGVPAAFLFTTNCIQKPRDSYKDQVFTTGLVGWPGVSHVHRNDFSVVIEKAIALGGFKETPGKTLMTGFARNAVLSVADKVIDAVKGGAIKHFFLVGGCDGAKPGRNYYTEFVEQAPKDTVILTLACGKFRFNHLDLGNIGGIPRLLDIGQCNDAYSAVKIAQALAEAFDVGINDLPLSLVLSWYEQKAVVILLSLLALGMKNIRLGPTLPAFITPNVLQFLVDQFEIKPITTPEEDLKAILD